MAPNKKKKVAPKKSGKSAAPKSVAKKKSGSKKTAAANKSGAGIKTKINTKIKTKTKAATARTQRSNAKAPKAKSNLKRVAKTIAAVAVPAALTTIAVKVGKKMMAAAATDYTTVLTPLDDRILVKAAAMGEKTAGGIIIPGTVEERPQRGEVLAVGSGRRNKKGKVRPLDVGVGDTVMFAESAGSKITIAGAELLIVREDEILGVAD